MKRTINFDSPTARVVLDRILERLDSGPANTVELIVASGKSTGRARDYIMRLRTIGQINCLVDAVFSFGGSTPAVWELNPAFAGAPTVDESVDQFPRLVVVRQQWKPNHVRMPMDCLLFGVPAAMQRMAA